MTEVKNKGGRPKKEIDEKVLLKLAQTMLPVESIADILECHKDTIYARFSDVLHRGRENRKCNLLECMWEKALVQKDTKMMIWLSKQYLGHKESLPEQATQVNFNVFPNEVPK